MAFDMRKFKRDIERAVDVNAKEAMKQVTKVEYQKIGDEAVDAMKEMIAVGVSPIKGAGRFPGYKWATFANAAKKANKSLSDKKHRAKSNRQVNNFIKGKYPWSMMKKFPGKQVRPVNLNLSGEMLQNLEARVQLQTIHIGYFDDLSALKEQGHREGVNDQPKRPTIPVKSEEFAPSVYRRIVDSVTDIFKKRFGT